MSQPEDDTFIALSWVCEDCHHEGNGRWQLADGRYCPKCGGSNIAATATLLKSMRTGKLSWGGGHWCDQCEDSLLLGVLFPWDSDIDIAGVEKCDLCSVYMWDDEAAAVLAERLGPEYEVRQCQVYEDLRQPGAVRLAVYRKGEPEPLTFDEGLELRRKLRAEDAEKAGAPSCPRPRPLELEGKPR